MRGRRRSVTINGQMQRRVLGTRQRPFRMIGASSLQAPSGMLLARQKFQRPVTCCPFLGIDPGPYRSSALEASEVDLFGLACLGLWR